MEDDIFRSKLAAFNVDNVHDILRGWETVVETLKLAQRPAAEVKLIQESFMAQLLTDLLARVSGNDRSASQTILESWNKKATAAGVSHDLKRALRTASFIASHVGGYMVDNHADRPLNLRPAAENPAPKG